MRGTGARVAALIALLVIVAALACRPEPPPVGPRYLEAPPPTQVRSFTFAVHPLHNPATLGATYRPLTDHLGRALPGTRFELVASRDYAEFEGKIRERGPAFLLPNPWQALRAQEAGYEVIAMAGDPEDFKGLLLVRRDSGIRELRDLRGRTISYPSPTAVAACIMPQSLLHGAGLDVMHEITHRYVGSQESSIMNVYLNLSTAGATWPPPWRAFQKAHPKEAAQLRVLAETPSLVNNAVMARKDVPPEIRDRVREVLLHLHEHPEGRGILEGMETRRFHPAEDATYDPVRRYLERFEREVRPVVQP